MSVVPWIRMSNYVRNCFLQQGVNSSTWSTFTSIIMFMNLFGMNERRAEDKLPLRHLLQKFPRDYKLIIVGDADMGRHEISDRGGSVEHFNAEPGEVWMSRLTEQFRSVVWLNPLPESRWQDSASIQLAKRLVDGRMFFLSDKGLESAMKYLMR
jgi:hypothetical protein